MAMLPLTCPYPTTREAAAETHAAAVSSGYEGLHAFPFNRFDADSSTWWLSPSTENPGYRYGKICFTPHATSPPDIFVGFHVEKGIGPSAAAVYRESAGSRRYVMESTWLWDRFLAGLQSGEIATVVAGVEAVARRSIVLAIDAANVALRGDGEDVRSPRLPRDRVRYEFSRGTLTWTDTDLRANLLGELGKPETLPALAAHIARLPQLDWMWMNVRAGFTFSHVQTGSRAETWTASDIWVRACLPWRAWLQ